ncbi:MAG: tetratricopeptide repeat protein [Phycisphaerales bacterium]|nr:tetratricopeptide repeat protein [Phycisphaerales bacterium]
MKLRTPTFSFFALLSASSILAVGCATQRPMVTAKAEADHAFRYGDYAKAAPAYLEIIEQYPGDADVDFRYGVCLAKLGNYREARMYVEAAAAAEPKNFEVTAGLAEVYFQLNDTQKLVQLLQDRGDSMQSEKTYLLLADYGMKLNDPDVATAAVNRAIVLGGGLDVAPYLKAADVAASVGETQLAQRRLRQAYTIDARNQVVRARLAEYGIAAEMTTGLPPID